MMYEWPEMWEYGIAHWLLFIVVVVAIVYPIGRILRRLGFSPFWSVLVFIPLVNLLSLWILAFSDWPSPRSGSGT
jgi:hypothetical protein